MFEALAIRDIRSSCDLFRNVWEETKGLDGYVSLEVSPTLANDTQGTIAAAQRLWNAVDRPNVMIKIPGTAAGVPAIKASIAAGININVTLLFSVDRYEDAANAYLEGLEERAQRGEPIDRLASVASVFVSRIDNAVDKKLQAKIDAGEQTLQTLLGKAAIASTKLTYQRFLKLFGGERFAALKAKGAHVQRPLWASTSTKNPAYPDLMYVENLVGRDTVNTVPPNTLEALVDHGTIRADAVLEDIDGARAVIEALAKAQISIYDVTETLVADGVKSFADSFNAMLDAIKGKLEKLRSGAPPPVSLALGDGARERRSVPRQARADELPAQAVARTTRRRGRTRPSTSRSSRRRSGGWRSRSRRTRRPASCASSRARARSGSTTSSCSAWAAARSRPTCCARRSARSPATRSCTCSTRRTRSRSRRSTTASTSRARCSSSRRSPARPPSPTRSSATSSSACSKPSAPRTRPASSSRSPIPAPSSSKKRRTPASCACSPTTRTSAGATPRCRTSGWCPRRWPATTSPASSTARSTRCTRTRRPSSAYDAPGVRFGAAIGSLAKNGRDKLTILAHPSVAAFGAWAEQLIAESTGKSGTGIVPVAGEPLGATDAYGDDRVFVYVGECLPGDDPRARRGSRSSRAPAIR